MPIVRAVRGPIDREQEDEDRRPWMIQPKSSCASKLSAPKIAEAGEEDLHDDPDGDQQGEPVVGDA